MGSKIRVIDLFAGVGGFRIGLENASKRFSFVWSNQWEPSRKAQHASNIYASRFGANNHSNEDIALVDASSIPSFDLVVGGFPCQDYSVAKTLRQSTGLAGKKGVLWWEIYRIIQEQNTRPKYLFLENVDRLLKSPASQRGRDFAIMLACLSSLGYAVEWRMINAADYGFPQRRRRVYIVGYHKSTGLFKASKGSEPQDWILKQGVFGKEFRVNDSFSDWSHFSLDNDVVEISKDFNKGGNESWFQNAGFMINHEVFTGKVTPKYSGKHITLGDILLPEEEVPEEFFIKEDSLEKWKYLKGAKREERTNKSHDFKYFYTEGPMVFPDALDKASRTIVTGEGGSSASRFKHVVTCPSGRLRRLTPVELERLNMFPDNHTEEASPVMRAFLMGNALVVGVVTKIGRGLLTRIDEHN